MHTSYEVPKMKFNSKMGYGIKKLAPILKFECFGFPLFDDDFSLLHTWILFNHILNWSRTNIPEIHEPCEASQIQHVILCN